MTIKESFSKRCVGSARGAIRGAAAVVMAISYASGWADAGADQRERARVWRELLEAQTPPLPAASSLPGASIPADTEQLLAAQRRRLLAEKQWRSLLSSQQMQRFGPASQAGAQSTWRGQTLDRERKAEALSADILQRSRSYLSNGQR